MALATITSAQSYSFTAGPTAYEKSSYRTTENSTANSQKTVIRRDIDMGISQGDNMVSVMLGAGFPLGDSGIDLEESSKPKWGGTGFNYGLSYMNFLTEYSELITTKMDLFNVMLTGRLNVNPKEQVRVYFPFGVGFTSAKGTFKVKAEDSYYGAFDEKYSATTTSLGYFLGLGFESTVGDIDNRISVGLELRYNGFSFDTDKLLDGMKLNGKQHYSYVSFLGKIGYRF